MYDNRQEFGKKRSPSVRVDSVIDYVRERGPGSKVVFEDRSLGQPAVVSSDVVKFEGSEVISSSSESRLLFDQPSSVNQFRDSQV